MGGSAAPRILVFGGAGQVGRELRRALAERGQLTVLDRAAADYTDLDALRRQVHAHRPDVIVNAAAYTAVDRAESEPELARVVNADAPEALAHAAQEAGACLVHYSTDYVFDGRKTTAYTEEDDTGPLSVYGRTKLAGELAVARSCGRHLIFRTSWVFGVDGNNFLKTILRAAATRDELRVVSDQIGAPTSAARIADVTATVLHMLTDGDAEDFPWGTYHLTSAGSTSWYEYARHAIARGCERGFVLKASADSVHPISTAEFGAAAPRPGNSRLCTEKLRTTWDVRLPDWRDEVDGVIHALARTGTS